jgi:hypothetical protein
MINRDERFFEGGGKPFGGRPADNQRRRKPRASGGGDSVNVTPVNPRIRLRLPRIFSLKLRLCLLILIMAFKSIYHGFVCLSSGK